MAASETMTFTTSFGKAVSAGTYSCANNGSLIPPSLKCLSKDDTKAPTMAVRSAAPVCGLVCMRVRPLFASPCGCMQPGVLKPTPAHTRSRCSRSHACTHMPGLQPTTLTLTMAGSVSDFTPAVLAAVKSSLAQASGVPESSIGLTVQAGSVVLAVSMPSSAAATVRSLIQSGTLPQLGGRTVESVVLSSTQVARTVAPTPLPQL
jgi:hypothetical protein